MKVLGESREKRPPPIRGKSRQEKKSTFRPKSELFDVAEALHSRETLRHSRQEDGTLFKSHRPNVDGRSKWTNAIPHKVGESSN